MIPPHIRDSFLIIRAGRVRIAAKGLPAITVIPAIAVLMGLWMFLR
jgi:hypothetical protein